MIPFFPAPLRGQIGPDMISAFHRDGVLVLEDMISDVTCKALMAQMDHIIASYEPQEHVTVFETLENSQASDVYFLNSSKNISFFFEDGALGADGRQLVPVEQGLNKVGHGLHSQDPVFRAFCEDPTFVRLLTALGLQRPEAVQSMYIFKQPGIGGEVRCHQDSSYMWTERQSCVGLWFALEDATLENGCLKAVAGGHKEAMPRQRLRRLGPGSLQTEMQIFDECQWDARAAEPLEVRAGTMVVLHGQLPHLSAANTSACSRHAFALHFIDGVCEYAPDNWLER